MLSSACISILRRIVLTPFGGTYNQAGYAGGICGGGCVGGACHVGGGGCTGGAGCAGGAGQIAGGGGELYNGGAGGRVGAGVVASCDAGGTRAVIISSDMATLINTGRKDSLVRMSALG